MIETKRLKIYAATKKMMEKFIATQTVDELKTAYQEMLDGSLKHPEQWEWYAIWMIELKDGTHIGELCFKGVDKDDSTEIGYGICDEYQGKGYATETVRAITKWALEQPGITCVKAKTDKENIASQRVLEKSGFKRTSLSLELFTYLLKPSIDAEKDHERRQSKKLDDKAAEESD